MRTRNVYMTKCKPRSTGGRLILVLLPDFADTPYSEVDAGETRHEGQLPH